MAVKLNKKTKTSEVAVQLTAKKDVAGTKEPSGAGDEIDFRLVEIDDVEPNSWNPNDMEAEFFETIVQQVREEGMHQPILCRLNPEKEGKFLIVDGEHRWRAAKIAGKKKIGIVVVPFDETRAKVRTLSMNSLRGQNIPIKLARLLVDLHEEYTPQQIRAMTGIGEDEQVSVLKLLEVPEFNPSDGIKISSTDVERPISVSIILLPDEHGAYTTAMKKAMKLMGDDVTALIGHEVASYDKAMKAAMGIAGAKLRNVALALVCETFNSLPADMQSQIAKAAHAKIYDKLAQDAEAKEAKKQKADKKVS
ncbi:MAG: ParB/RepB/Spo0J family partition protein [Burkholderiaceae bacterium]|nr:ParB/RepB/Spo0J family partition protein [Burkholderiaceae bacterium]